MARRKRRLLPDPSKAVEVGGACAVSWCCALPGPQSPLRCAVHANGKYHDLRPQLLDPDEELIDGAFGQCLDCEGSGRCDECDGLRVCGDECGHGHRCEHYCERCEGNGDCTACGGSGFGGVRKIDINSEVA